MEIDELLNVLMGNPGHVEYQRAQLEFEILRESDNFVGLLHTYIAEGRRIDDQVAIFLLTQIKSFAGGLERYAADVRNYFLQQIYDVICSLSQSQFFDLAIETLYVTISHFGTEELQCLAPSALFVSAFARLAKNRISARRLFNEFFRDNYELLLNADGVYGLIDALEPVPPISYGECLGTVLDAVLSERFTKKNNKLLRVICLAASKMKNSQRTLKDNMQFYDAVRERNEAIEEFSYKRIESNEFVCDNLLILTYLIKMGFDFGFDNLEQLLSFCIMIFREEFQAKYNELADFEYTSDLEFLLDEYVGLIGAAAGLFLQICSKLQEQQLCIEIEDKKQKLLSDQDNFFVETLEIVLLIKACREKSKDGEFYGMIHELIVLYISLLQSGVLANTWANWCLDELFMHTAAQGNRYDQIIPVINDQAVRLPTMTSKLQVCFCIKLVFDRLEEIFTDKASIHESIIAAIDSRGMLNSFAYILLNIQEQHYLFQKSLDAVKMVISLLTDGNKGLAVEFGNNLILSIEEEPDKFSKLLEALIMIFGGAPMQLAENSAEILLNFVEQALQQFVQHFSQDEYTILHGCSEAIELLTVNYENYGRNERACFYTMYRYLWSIIDAHHDYFAECIEGILTLTSFLNLDRATIIFPTEYEPFCVIQLLELCINECIAAEDLQREVFIDACEFPINWILLVLEYCAKHLNAEQMYEACAFLYQCQDGPRGSLAVKLGVEEFAAAAMQCETESISFGQPESVITQLEPGIMANQENLEAIRMQAIGWLCESRAIRVEDTSVFDQLFYQGEEQFVNNILEQVVV